MSAYPVPGDWFDALPKLDGDDDYVYEDDYEAEAAPRGGNPDIEALRAVAKELVEQGNYGPAHRIRVVCARLDHNWQELQRTAWARYEAEVMSQPWTAPAHAGAESSPVGNCKKCGDSLPLPTMKRGRPRTYCESCSPSRKKAVINIG